VDIGPGPPDPRARLPRYIWWQVTSTLLSLLPPPLNDTPPALLARNQAALARVADMAPVNGRECRPAGASERPALLLPLATESV
jgi:hypothetical protein